jgi:hypothetical protein
MLETTSLAADRHQGVRDRSGIERFAIEVGYPAA